MTPLTLNWAPWVYGLFSALIGGGAGAVSAAIGVNIMDPKDWGISDHPVHLLELMGVCFIINGAIATFAYLAKSPLPQIETTTVQSVSAIKADGAPTIVKSTVTTTTKETAAPEAK